MATAGIDKAIKYGFGFRLRAGMLEFIDWGGGDILCAPAATSPGAGQRTLRPPEIVERNMRDGRIGLSTRQGFLDYENLDIEAYRRDRLAAFVAMLRQLGLAKPPVLGE